MSTPNRSALDSEDLDHARACIAQVETEFTYAKTVPKHPHEYLVRSWLASQQQTGFDRLCRLIVNHGYRGTYWEKTWVYLDVDGWRYWESNSWFGDGGKILNRARNEDTQL